MGFRVISIKSRCKLEYCLNYLVFKSEETKRILLDEIELMIIDTPQVSITSALLIELSKRKIKVIFCDEKHCPQFEAVSYQNNSLSYKKIKEQILWEDDIKNLIWKEIIKEKIKNSAKTLSLLNYLDERDLLIKYMNEVSNGDETSREGHAAKVYFNALFGNNFSRRDDDITENKYLNYGYSILASFISREIKLHGYLTELGIHHIGENNPFNFTYDLIEPLRAYIDYFVVTKKVNECNYRNFFGSILGNKVIIDSKEMFLDNAIHLYVISIISALNEKDTNKIKFIQYEL